MRAKTHNAFLTACHSQALFIHAILPRRIRCNNYKNSGILDFIFRSMPAEFLR